jgi:pyruvate dehydrogenase E1 component
VLEEIQRRVLWLAVRIVDTADWERDTADGVKVGAHQTASASLVPVMTGLERSHLTTLRARGGLQSDRSRTRDPYDVGFSTGSVGLGAAAPLFAADARRYVDVFGQSGWVPELYEVRDLLPGSTANAALAAPSLP